MVSNAKQGTRCRRVNQAVHAEFLSEFLSDQISLADDMSGWKSKRINCLLESKKSISEWEG